MTPWLDDGDVQVHVGDVRAVLAAMPDESVDCVITSPPYWGLRDYGTGSWDGGDPACDHVKTTQHREQPDRPRGWDGAFRHTSEPLPVSYGDVCGKCGARRVDQQLGLEPTPDLYVQNMVAVFREIRRVLSPWGTCWLNLGSSYNSNEPGGFSGSTLTKGGKQTASSRGVRRGAPAYGNGGTAPPGSPAPDSACLGLCDGCLDDFRSHRDRTAGKTPPPSPAAPPFEPTDRGSEPAGSAQASPDASPPADQESTTLESWLRLRGSCSRCDARASSLSAVRSSTDDAPASAHMSWLNYTRALKPKDLVPTPWMVAMALQADGWWLRSEIIWAKPNPMPESVTDRPTKSHEQVFLLAKRPSYWFDAEAVREPATNGERFHGSYAAPTPTGPQRTSARNGRGDADNTTAGRNVRSVWNIATQPFPEAHFATYPEELVRRCLLAGCPAEVCGVCGKPRERIVERETNWQERRAAGAWAGNVGIADNYQSNVHGEGMSHDLGGGAVKTTGWSDCGHNAYRPGRVLDPFLGSGTTALVARHHGRHAIGIELSPEYARIATKRLQQLSLLA